MVRDLGLRMGTVGGLTVRENGASTKHGDLLLPLRVGNIFRVNLRDFRIVIEDETDHVTTCEFIAGALVRTGDPTPMVEYRVGVGQRILRREFKAGPLRIEIQMIRRHWSNIKASPTYSVPNIHL